MELGQLIEHKIRNNFREKSFTKCDVVTISRPFSKKNQYWAHLWINGLKFYTASFYYMPSWEPSKYISGIYYLNIYNLILLCIKVFQNNKNLKEQKRDLELVSLPHFLHDFYRKIILLYSIPWANLIAWLPLLCGILSNLCIVNVFFTRLWRHKIWN